MRVMHVVPGYAPAQGGIESLVDGVGPFLAESGVTCSILAPRRWFDRPDDYVSHGMNVESVDLPSYHSEQATITPVVRQFSRVRRAIERQRPDVLHIHGIGQLLVPATRVAQSLGIAVIHHIHGDVHPDLLETEARAIRDSARVIAVSHPTAASIRRVTGRTDAIEVLGNGIPTPGVELTSDRRGLVMVGRLESNKGFDHGIEAFAALRWRHPRLRLRIVGVGEELIMLQELAWFTGVGDRVDFLGRCSRKETQEVIAHSSVVLVPSLSIEGFSLVAAEAALLGTPCVAYRTGGLATTVVDGISGLLVEREDVMGLAAAVSNIIEDKQLALRLSTGARELAASAFNVERYADQLRRLYDSVLNEHRKPVA